MCASQSQVQSYFFNDEVKKNKDKTWSCSLWVAEHSQTNAKNLCKSYSSAKSIYVFKDQEINDD